MSATEVVRNFSEILNSVKYKGNHYTVVRGGKPVACISPAGNVLREKTLSELNEVLKKLPALGEDTEKFSRDIREIIRHQPALPRRSMWE